MKLKFPVAAGIISQIAFSSTAFAFSTVNPTTLVKLIKPSFLAAVPTRGGLSFEEENIKTTEGVSKGSPGGPASPFQDRGKLNEIDFCMSPADVSLSRLYQTSSNDSVGADSINTVSDNVISSNNGSNSDAPRIVSLTRALNNASNRAVRRILLSRSWPSPEALNISLRQVLASGSKKTASSVETTVTEISATKSDDSDNEKQTKESNEAGSDGESTAKCPVPRPILNIIMNEQDSNKSLAENAVTDGQSPEVTSPAPLGRKGSTDEQWVSDQLVAFKETYGDIEGYKFAEAYMECILNLATSGIESPRVMEVLDQGVYEDSYRRIISVLKSVGVAFEGFEEDLEVPRMKIASKLLDQDICLSMLDKINIQNGDKNRVEIGGVREVAGERDQEVNKLSDNVVEDAKEEAVVLTGGEKVDVNGAAKSQDEDKREKNLKDKLLYWMSTKKDEEPKKEIVEVNSEEIDDSLPNSVKDTEEVEETIKPEDLGGVLLSKEEPTITRQLNILSNIVKRTLLFGGDQEILVLSKTLEADRPAFIKQWYPHELTPMESDNLESETRAGVQFFNCLVQLLKDCYDNGIVTSLDPTLPLTTSYANSYERLTALLAELGSGYIKPTNENKMLKKKPQTPKEELIRFSQWEVALRQTQPDVSDFPSDLVGSWQVKDEIGGKVIGTSTVVFKPEGEVEVSAPLKGLQWRLDPGPTHLDTCTFQVLSEDGAILQYRGFMDRGARLESRFSKRSIKIRGGVSFQMRDSDMAMVGDDYKRDLLPIDTGTGTRFVMSKVFDLENN